MSAAGARSQVFLALYGLAPKTHDQTDPLTYRARRQYWHPSTSVIAASVTGRAIHATRQGFSSSRSQPLS